MVASIFRNKTWVVACFFFVILIAISFFSTDNSPKQYPDYLVKSPSPTGTKALYTYLEQHDQPISTTEELPIVSNTGETRILLNPPVFSNVEVTHRYNQYIKSGNHLIIGKENPDGLFDIETQYLPETMLSEAKTTEVTTSTQSYQVSLESRFRLEKHKHDKVLLEDEHGVIALKRKVGEGSLTVFLEPGWLTNEYITEHDHLPVLFKLNPFEKAKPIIFDEFSVAKTGGASSIFELYPNWAYVLLIEGLLITILILWHQGKRFGSIQPVREETVRFSDERLQAIANWHLKGKNYKESVENQLYYLQDTIRERYGIPYHESWQERIKKMATKLSSLSKEEWRQLFNDLDIIMQKQSLNKHEYLHWSKLIDKMRKEVESG